MHHIGGLRSRFRRAQPTRPTRPLLGLFQRNGASSQVSPAADGKVDA